MDSCGLDDCGGTSDEFSLPPDIEQIVKTYAHIYDVPWQVVAGLLKSEIELDTQPRDAFETAFLHLVPEATQHGPIEGRGAARVILKVALWIKPDPGPGIGNVHVSTARHVSAYHSTHYARAPRMQLRLHDLSTEEVAYRLTYDRMNIKVVAAYARLLADYRFGANGYPCRMSHADLSEWTMTDALAIWHGYRYGVEDASPFGLDKGFQIENFQDRSPGVNTLIGLAKGTDRESSISSTFKYFSHYWGQRESWER